MNATSEPAPHDGAPLTAALLEALSGAGYFRAGACLLGAMAYQTYPVLLGAGLPGARVPIGDGPQPGAVTGSPLVLVEIPPAGGDRMPAAIDVLRSVDASFAVFGPEVIDLRQASEAAQSAGGRARQRPEKRTGFVNRDGYRVELLHRNRPAGGDPETFLDFLVTDPVAAVIRHQAGIAVAVPSPQRFAVFLVMVVAARLEPTGKQMDPQPVDLRLSKEQLRALADDVGRTVDRDLAKVTAIVGALAPQRARDLFEAWRDAFARGPAWEIALALGRELMDQPTRAALDGAVRQAGIDVGFE